MSAGLTTSSAQPSKDLHKLAPFFRIAVLKALADCHKDGLDAFVFEAYRSNELQKIYYARGRTVRPPEHTVTNAPDNLRSWHGYGLAVDVISQEKYWDKSMEWFADVAEHFKAHDCDWGGDWRRPDFPHFQWGTLKASPSDKARELIQETGVRSVWAAVGAI